MDQLDARYRVDRGYRAADLLRHAVLQEAVTEMNRRAFQDFLNSTLTPNGKVQRKHAVRMVHGAQVLLSILNEWVVEGHQLQEEMELENA